MSRYKLKKLAFVYLDFDVIRWTVQEVDVDTASIMLCNRGNQSRQGVAGIIPKCAMHLFGFIAMKVVESGANVIAHRTRIINQYNSLKFSSATIDKVDQILCSGVQALTSIWRGPNSFDVVWPDRRVATRCCPKGLRVGIYMENLSLPRVC